MALHTRTKPHSEDRILYPRSNLPDPGGSSVSIMYFDRSFVICEDGSFCSVFVVFSVLIDGPIF